MTLATGEFIITMDDDCQHAPEDIPLLLEFSNHDAVMAQLAEKRHGLLKRIASSAKGKFDEVILGKPKNLRLSSFRLFRRETVQGMLKLMNTPFPFISAMMFYVTKDVVGVPVKHHERAEGKSGYSVAKMVALFKNLLINQSSILLGIIGNIGLTASVMSIVGACYVIYRKLFLDVAIAGWASLLVAVLLFGGLALFSLGIIGEYLIRIIGAAERRPIFLVREDLQ